MKTLGMKVEDIGFLIDRLGRDCASDQYLRELTQNSSEAIIRTGRPDGRIVWDFVEQNGARKLCICAGLRVACTRVRSSTAVPSHGLEHS